MEHAHHSGLEHYIRPRWRRYGLRLILMAILWVALNGADGKSWIVGAPIVVLAAAANFPFLAGEMGEMGSGLDILQ